MILPERVFGMSGTIHTFFGRAILPISVSIAVADLLLDLLARGEAGLERDVHLDDPAAELVDHRHRGGLGDLVDGEAGRLELLGAQPVPGDVDHVVDPAEDPEVAVGRLRRRRRRRSTASRASPCSSGSRQYFA